MTIEQTEGTPPEMPGKTYESVPDLKKDMDSLSAVRTLRFWGQKYEARPSETLKGAITYHLVNMPQDPEAFFDARIFRVDDPDNPKSIGLDVFDYTRKQGIDFRFVDSMRLIDKNIGRYRIEPMPETRWQNEMAKRYPETWGGKTED